MQEPKSASLEEAKAPGVVSTSQRIVYSVPWESVYTSLFAAGHCGPEGVFADGEGEGGCVVVSGEKLDEGIIIDEVEELEDDVACKDDDETMTELERAIEGDDAGADDEERIAEKVA